MPAVNIRVRGDQGPVERVLRRHRVAADNASERLLDLVQTDAGIGQRPPDRGLGHHVVGLSPPWRGELDHADPGGEHLPAHRIVPAARIISANERTRAASSSSTGRRSGDEVGDRLGENPVENGVRGARTDSEHGPGQLRAAIRSDTRLPGAGDAKDATEGNRAQLLDIFDCRALISSTAPSR